MPTGNESAADELTRHRLALLRYEAGVTRDLVTAYEGALADVKRELAAIQRRIDSGRSTNVVGRDRLASLGADLTQRIREAQRVAALGMDARLLEVAEAEDAFHARMLPESFGVSFARVPEEAVAAMVHTPLGGGLWTDRLAADLLGAHDGIQATLARAMARGASIPNIARALRDAGAIEETYRGRLVSIARTEVQRVANSVAIATYRENDDVLSGMQWLATLDSKTCLVCAPLHNKVYRFKNAKEMAAFRQAPLHPRCRCFASPVSKSWRDIGIDVPKGARNLLTERPAEDTTFEAWLRRQPRQTQSDFFHSEPKLDAWRAGEIAMDKFSDRGRVLNLGELRARYPEAIPE